MNPVITVGLPGPVLPATATSPPADTGAGTAAPFARVLSGAGPPGPMSAGTGSEPPGLPPGSLDLASVIQLLLGPNAGAGDQTGNESSRPDRAAGAGINQAEPIGGLAGGEMLVAMMAQLAPASAETEGDPRWLVPLAAQAAGQPSDGRVPSTVAALESIVVPGEGTGAASGRSESTFEAPRVVLPSSAATAPRSEVASVAIPAGDQQHAVPQGAPVAQPESTAPAVTTEAEGGSPLNLDELTPEMAAEPVDVEPVAQATAKVEPQATATEPAASAIADAVELLAPAAPQRATPAAGSTGTTAAAESTATAAGAEVFTSELASTVRRASLLGDQEVRLLLNPPELGHLDIRVVESPEGLRIVLEATSAEARELIEQQLPALRNALEARDLKVERIQVEQALEPSATDEQSERGLRQDSQGDGGTESGQDAAPWSPVASIRGDDPASMAAAVDDGGSESTAQTSTGSGRLNVLA